MLSKPVKFFEVQHKGPRPRTGHLDFHFLSGVLHLFPMIDQEHPLFLPFPQRMFKSTLKATLNGPDCGLSNSTFTYLHLSFLQSYEGDMEGKLSEHPAHWLFIVSVESFEKRNSKPCEEWLENTAVVSGKRGLLRL